MMWARPVSDWAACGSTATASSFLNAAGRLGE